MIRHIIKYIYPPRRMYSIPKHISAEYDRVQMTPEEELILMAGMARDPAGAREAFVDLEQEHGNQVWQYIQLQLRKKRTMTAKQRFWMLVRQVLGEGEPRKVERRRTIEPIVYSNFKSKETDSC